MSDTTSPDYLLEDRGTHRALDGYIVSACFDRSTAHLAFALGDGTVHITKTADATTDWNRVEAHDGGVLSLAPDCVPGGFVTGGDDGKFLRIAADGTTAVLADFGGKWVDHVTTHADKKDRGLLAAAVGKNVHVFDERGQTLKQLPHPTTVTGITFDAKGKRVAASHYNGASLWFVASKSDTPRVLEWKGSHTGITMNPAGDHVVTSMQENALHGWRLTDNQHMRMSGYPSKSRFIAFTKSGKWLASSGAEGIVLWPFTGGGPMGKQPMEMASGDDVLCTAVATHPQHEVCAAGFSDGLVVLADITSGRVLPVAAPGRGSVSAISWSPDGTYLAFGTETGFAAVVDFSKR